MIYSIKDVEKKINNDALKSFSESFGPSRYRNYLEAIRTQRISSFRLNPLRTNRHEAIRELQQEGIKFKEYSAIDYAFQLLGPEGKFQKTTPYKEGKLYLQGLSGMLPPVLLNPKAGMKVLDMAAAPGSKTTMLGALMENTGIIHALEPDFIRMERLKFNCQQLGITCVEFFQTEAQKFDGEANSYDAILADVPCSGEGRFNLYDTPSYCFWKPADIPRFVRTQFKIMNKAVELLKPGGRLVYSTCTMNKEENEGVLETLLNENPSLSCLEIPEFKSKPQEYEIENNKKVKFLRVFPSTNFEGFFVSILTKK